MTFEEAKESLKQGYVKANFELVDEHPEELFFTFRSEQYKISKADIDNYLQVNNQKADFESQPCECSIVSKTYREQIVANLHPRARFMGPRHWNYHFGVQDSQGVHVEIGQCSDMFVDYFRFQEQYLELCLDGTMRFRARNRQGENGAELKECLYRPLTIKVFNLNEANNKAAIQKSNDVIESCIFALSSLKGNPIELLEEWPLRRPRATKEPRDFEYEQTERNSSLPMPKFKLNSILVRLYQQATSSDIPSLKYLSFYQILEFYFLSVADENLYNSLTRRINDLKFKSTPNHLDKLIQDVVSHKRENDETEMLKNVIKKYVDEEEIINFIVEYERFLERKVYTVKRVVFGNDISATTLNPGHVIGNIAKIIKAIRNALVHSSDRYERNDRYIPYSKEGTTLLELEIPLIKFLADKLIISTSTNL
jgi:hypothetical protein